MYSAWKTTTPTALLKSSKFGGVQVLQRQQPELWYELDYRSRVYGGYNDKSYNKQLQPPQPATTEEQPITSAMTCPSCVNSLKERAG